MPLMILIQKKKKPHLKHREGAAGGGPGPAWQPRGGWGSRPAGSLLGRCPLVRPEERKQEAAGKRGLCPGQGAHRDRDAEGFGARGEAAWGPDARPDPAAPEGEPCRSGRCVRRLPARIRVTGVGGGDESPTARRADPSLKVTAPEVCTAEAPGSCSARARVARLGAAGSRGRGEVAGGARRATGEGVEAGNRGPSFSFRAGCLVMINLIFFSRSLSLLIPVLGDNKNPRAVDLPALS